MPNYTLPDGETVKNKLGARSHDELETLEVGPVVARHTEHLLDPRIPRTFDTAHLKAIHRHLFQDIYEWVGKWRARHLPANQQWPIMRSSHSFLAACRDLPGYLLHIIPAWLEGIKPR